MVLTSFFGSNQFAVELLIDIVQNTCRGPGVRGSGCGCAVFPSTSKSSKHKMFYSTDNGALSHVNCDPQANTDVSGIGVRTSLYLQALLSILLSLGETTSSSIIGTNVALQVTTLSQRTSPDVDVPHTIMVTHYVMMTSMSRITASDLAFRYLRTKDGLRGVTVLWLMDLVFRPILLVFNLAVWVRIRELQRQGALCQNGSGKWIFFGKVKEISIADSASDFAFACVILDVIWEVAMVIAGIARLCLDDI